MPTPSAHMKMATCASKHSIMATLQKKRGDQGQPDTAKWANKPNGRRSLSWFDLLPVGLLSRITYKPEFFSGFLFTAAKVASITAMFFFYNLILYPAVPIHDSHRKPVVLRQVISIQTQAASEIAQTFCPLQVQFASEREKYFGWISSFFKPSTWNYLHLKWINLYRNDFYRNDFVSKRPVTISYIHYFLVLTFLEGSKVVRRYFLH